MEDFFLEKLKNILFIWRKKIFELIKQFKRDLGHIQQAVIGTVI